MRVMRKYFLGFRPRIVEKTSNFFKHLNEDPKFFS